MSALSELDEYISRNEPAVSFAHTGRSSFEQRPAQKVIGVSWWSRLLYCASADCCSSCVFHHGVLG